MQRLAGLQADFQPLRRWLRTAEVHRQARTGDSDFARINPSINPRLQRERLAATNSTPTPKVKKLMLQLHYIK
jgi:hypothetical protein